MKFGSLASSLAVIALTMLPAGAQQAQSGDAIERRIPVANGSLYTREVGNGPAIVVLHGGPDFDHRYLLPDLDRLKDSYRLIYYDQRGRGQSADSIRAEDVSLASDLADLEMLRRYFRFEGMTLLGHSWGALLALEFALRYPASVSRLILMNPAPASAGDYALLRRSYQEKLGADMERQNEIVAGAQYQAGEPETVAERYRIHFKAAVARNEDFEKLMTALKAAFISQGKEGIVKARAVEDRLMRDTWQVTGYDLLPRLRALTMPTLVITGDHDFIPLEVAQRIARGMPRAKLVTIKNCGHFAYLECPDDVRNALTEFFRAGR